MRHLALLLDLCDTAAIHVERAIAHGSDHHTSAALTFAQYAADQLRDFRANAVTISPDRANGHLLDIKAFIGAARDVSTDEHQQSLLATSMRAVTKAIGAMQAGDQQ